ncbi:hypothetical protein B0T17DRAFT_619823 [Bombardia bombarda]|uniref:2,6-dihydroxypyridine 3-monooxygenase substrate binding domain-containing protein n=1 Tax=Bombardia bombarda TaxID=252184 RepID=A0AA39WGI3_9PEZI|nr:hypothetical protein B0T17DRAFT_619823 [Bombardia bombarda]
MADPDLAMTDMKGDRPKTVVIVGGSLSGLMHGIQLKSLGHNVTVLEQDPSSMRKSHAAGISFGANMEEFLKRYDRNNSSTTPTSIKATGSHVSFRTHPQVHHVNIARKNTCWGVLYRVFRANFDGLQTELCPGPPKHRDGDGQASYCTGKKVVALEYDHDQAEIGRVGKKATGKVVVLVEDVTSGKRDKPFLADLVIGADGFHSTVKQLVLPQNAPAAELEYSGYVAWRGTIAENEVSAETREFFKNGFAFDFMSRSYILVYIIPTDTGIFAPGTRLLNLVWYYNIPHSAPEKMDAVFTDIDNQHHTNTVPAGLVNPAIWGQCRDSMLPNMAPAFVELVKKIDQPFVTRISDSVAILPSNLFWDGRVALVGDAFATVRPHLGRATDHAAWQCLEMGKLWRGEITTEQWERELRVETERLWLLSKGLGECGQGTWGNFLRVLLTYVIFLVRCKM